MATDQLTGSYQTYSAYVLEIKAYMQLCSSAFKEKC